MAHDLGSTSPVFLSLSAQYNAIFVCLWSVGVAAGGKNNASQHATLHSQPESSLWHSTLMPVLYTRVYFAATFGNSAQMERIVDRIFGSDFQRGYIRSIKK